MNYYHLLLFAVFVGGCSFETASKQQWENNKDTVGVIYGEDSVKEITDRISNSQISIAFVPKVSLKKYINHEPVETVVDRVGFVEGINWIDDPAIALCSGVLIDKDLVLTAGHCFQEIGPCDDLDVVFNFQSIPIVLEKINAVSCKEVIAHKNDLLEKGLDYALVRLENSVNMPDVKIASYDVEVGEQIYTIGYPLGSPMKKAEGTIRKIMPDLGLYNSNLDVYEGNSGSPVFSAKTHQLLGIVSSGESDFDDIDPETVSDPQNELAVPIVKHCANDECLGETIIPIQKILADIQK